MTEAPNDISSDLEWILESGQADREMLIEALVQEHYLHVYQLALAMLGNTRNAHQAAMQAIAAASLDFPQRKGITQVNTWLYSHAAKTITQLETAGKDDISEGHTVAEDIQHLPEESAESQVFAYFTSQGRKERFALAYYYLLEFDLDEIATLLQVNRAAVSTQLEIARGDLRQMPLPGLEEISSLPTGYSEVQIRAEQQANLDAIIREAFQISYPAPELDSDDWARIVEQIIQFEIEQSNVWQRAIGRRKITIAISAIIVIICLVWVTSMLLGNPPLPSFGNLFPESSTDDGTTLDQPIATDQPVFPPSGEEQAYIYIVQPGDSLESIAQTLAIPQDQLSEWNDIDLNTILSPGEQLFVVPYASNYTLEPTESALESKPAKTRLKQSDDSVEVTQMLRTSADRWDTMWVDAYLVNYGPVGYIGGPRIYHSQAWVDQPEQSLELLGLLNEDPSSVRLISDNKEYRLNPGNQLPILSPWEADRTSLLYSQQLREMIFPQSAPWVSLEGRFQIIGNDEIAGRETVVVDWFNQLDQREARLWLDVITGTTLRLQEFGGPDYQTLLSDALVTGISYDLEVPGEVLFDPHSLLNQGYATLAEEGDVPIDPYATLSDLPLAKRSPLPIDPAPVGFNPVTSWLHFQFTETEHHNTAVGSLPSDPATLFADGYYLGQAAIPPPWGLQCTRSPDGHRLAFNLSGDGVQPPDLNLHWLNVLEPGTYYDPLPGFEASYFAFSPDSRQLAIFGRDPQNSFSGIQIVDIGTGESQSLMQLAHADSLVWSPDGSYLALVGQKPDSPNNLIMIVQVRLGEVIFERPVQLSGGTQQFSWSSMAWGLEFPLPMGDMGTCAEPPGT